MSALGSRRAGRRAVVIGGSMSGLFTAALLRRAGWDADVFERSPVELVGRGAGITAHPELLDVLELMDVTGRSAPRLLVHRNWSPPFGGGTHNCLPLSDRDLLIVADEAVLDHQEDGLKLVWVFDIREPTNPVGIATMPTPAEADYVAKGGHFGPHNIHENRPGSLVSSDLIFACACSTSATRTVRSRSPRWCRRPRRAWPITGPAGRA